MSDLEFVQTNAGKEQVWRRNKLSSNSRVVRLKEYDAFAVIDGERTKIGCVYQRLATFEQKPAGQRYVNRRWESPRWYADLVGQPRRYRQLPCETRKEAAAGLLADFLRERAA